MTRAPSKPPAKPPARPTAPRRSRDPRDTPAMRQYRRFKQEHPDCVLFFRMGDFYEMFDDDARLTHRVLGLTLTQRTEGIPMSGVPHHALEGYLRRMVEQGHRVAVCEQIEDPREAKGVVERAVTRVITPGTLVDEALLDESEANEIAAVGPAGADGTVVIAIAEASTGAFTLVDVSATALLDEIVRRRPSELLYCETDDGAMPAACRHARDAIGCATTARPAWTFRPDDAAERLRIHYGVATLAGFGLDDDDPALGPAGALLRYLQDTQTPDAKPGSGRLAHLRPPARVPRAATLRLDATTLRSLEIERTMRTGERSGSLLSILQRCTTAMGKRLFRQWLCFPLADAEAIGERQTAVATLVEDETLRASLIDRLARVQDVARIVARIAMRRATPRDLVALGGSLGPIGDLRAMLRDVPAFVKPCATLATLAETLTPLAERIARECVDTPPAHLREGGLFRDGIDGELDEYRGLQRDANGWLAEYQRELVAETKIPTLKVGFNKVFGYYIEVTHTHTAKVPDAFTRKQTLKNAERYITPELKTFEEKVTSAQSRAVERERVLFDTLSDDAAAGVNALAAYADVVAQLDVLACFAATAVRLGYTRPQLVPEPVLDIRGGRHPVLDHLLGERFVPNDCVLGRDTDDGRATLALITGPNMAGKSTFIRQIAIITLLAHTGSFVPADAAVIGLTDRIFTRIGSADELHTGQSTFMVEMTETANILHHATDRSLVILDEIGRGTSTLDGLALAWAIAETIASRRCRTLFATHYHELTDLADRREAVTNLHVSVREWGDDIVFLYRILAGRTDRSYGLHVAKIAGVPADTITRADAILETLTVHTGGVVPAPPPAEVSPGEQLGLFTEYLPHPVVERLATLDLDGLSPLEAFDLLRTLTRDAKEPS
ncbi:MAG: DNA mismatch repair protein MutS [Phycisphaerales bacterium]|nr:DNA mismatch repair protein MutS [Phycisphaerales bacterium]